MGRIDFERELYTLVAHALAKAEQLAAHRIEDALEYAMYDLSGRGRLKALRDAGRRGVTWPPESDFDFDVWLHDLMKIAAAQGDTKDYMMHQLEEECFDVGLPEFIERAYAEAQAKGRAG